MSKKLFIFSLAFLLIFPLAVLAINFPPLSGGGDVSFTDIIDGVLNIVWLLFTGFATIMFVVAGFLFLTANGEAGKINTAKGALLWGIIGVIVAILAFSIPIILSRILGV